MNARAKTSLPLTERGDVDTAALAERRLAEAAGHRTGRASLNAPRPEGEKVALATLTRGVSYRLSYSTPLVFEKGHAVPVTQVELDHLRDIYDPVTFSDGAQMIERRLRKFAFATTEGEPMPLEPLPDVLVGAAGQDAFERAEFERQAAG